MGPTARPASQARCAELPSPRAYSEAGLEGQLRATQLRVPLWTKLVVVVSPRRGNAAGFFRAARGCGTLCANEASQDLGQMFLRTEQLADSASPP